MKKYLALLLAIVLTLSFFTFTVSAADMEPTPYALLCVECGRAMRTETTYTREGHFKVQSCSIADGPHLHFEVYAQDYWVCKNVNCTEYNIRITKGYPYYSGTECGWL